MSNRNYLLVRNRRMKDICLFKQTSYKEFKMLYGRRLFPNGTWETYGNRVITQNDSKLDIEDNVLKRYSKTEFLNEFFEKFI